LVRVLHWGRRVPLSGTKEKRRAESVMDNKFALLFWSEKFHYPRYGRVEKEQSLSWMRCLHSSSVQCSQLGIDISTTRDGREKREQCLSWMRSLHSSSGPSFPLGTKSYTIRYRREKRNRVFYYPRYEREEKNRVRHG
jgi:hypothetical protein